MNDLTKHILTTLSPYLIGALFGILICLMFRGCGSSSSKVETVTIEKPVYTTKYVDRYKTDTVRFVSTQIFERFDTIYQTKTIKRLDTLLLIDTVKIVETWLSELNCYDTTLNLEAAEIRLRWENYQNISEKFRIDYTPKKQPLKWALGLHANAGLISNFSTRYTPLFGVGLQATIKRSYVGLDYGFNGSHYVGVRVGYNIISR